MQPCGKKRVFEPVADVHAVFFFAHDAGIIEGAVVNPKNGFRKAESEYRS
jgi:hypothetical protein